MEPLKSQAPAEGELLGTSAVRTLDIGTLMIEYLDFVRSWTNKMVPN